LTPQSASSRKAAHVTLAVAVHRHRRFCQGVMASAPVAPERAGPFAGDREFIIDEADDDTVRVTHVEDVDGVLFPVFDALMGSAIQRRHDAFNTALARRAEELAGRAATPL
jgi:hypothetical protein